MLVAQDPAARYASKAAQLYKQKLAQKSAEDAEKYPNTVVLTDEKDGDDEDSEPPAEKPVSGSAASPAITPAAINDDDADFFGDEGSASASADATGATAKKPAAANLSSRKV